MKRVYLCHPFSGNAKANRARVRQIELEILDDTINRWETYAEKVFPVNPLTIFPDHIDDTNLDRGIAMSFCLKLLSTCEELWICSDKITAGMQEEISFAAKNDIKIFFKLDWEWANAPYYEFVKTRYV